MKGTLTAGVIAGALAVVARVAATAGNDAPSLAITMAVITALGVGGAATIRVLFVERPSGRQTELKDLREHNRQLREDLIEADKALDDCQREMIAAMRDADRKLAESESKSWRVDRQVERLTDENAELTRQLAAARATIELLRGKP